ncbi:hypothetical protein F5888DRAFT_1631699 [Russula emetica]|nr:hypothetical protein F5888DRAFT_1631699 [Russula emetica]
MQRVHREPLAQAMTEDKAEEAVSTRSQKHEKAMAAHMPTAFALGAGISPVDTIVTMNPFNVYLCGHSLGLAELSDTLVESAAQQNSQPATNSQKRTEAAVGPTKQNGTGSEPEEAPEVPAWSNDQTTQHPKPPKPENPANSPESMPTLSFLGARAPFSIFPGKQYKPTLFRVRTEAPSPSSPVAQPIQSPIPIAAEQDIPSPTDSPEYSPGDSPESTNTAQSPEKEALGANTYIIPTGVVKPISWVEHPTSRKRTGCMPFHAGTDPPFTNTVRKAIPIGVQWKQQKGLKPNQGPKQRLGDCSSRTLDRNQTDSPEMSKDIHPVKHGTE